MSQFYRQVFRVICCGRNENVLEVTSFKTVTDERKKSCIPKQEDLNPNFISKNGLRFTNFQLNYESLRALNGWNEPWCSI